MNKHTPGPWKFEGRKIIDMTNSVTAIVGSNDTDEDRDFCNGKLIAAAPEMLEALESVLQDFSALNVQHEITLKQVMSALKKARGESE